MNEFVPDTEQGSKNKQQSSLWTPRCEMDVLLLFSVIASSIVILSADKCDPWRGVIGSVNRETRGLDMSCSQNKTECTRWNCNGSYRHTVNIASFLDDLTSINVDFCFGMSFHGCGSTPYFNIYFQVPSKNNTFVKNNIYYSDIVQVDGLQFSVHEAKMFIHANVFLDFNYTKISRESVDFSVRTKVEVHYLGDLIQEFVPELERYFVPPTTFTVKCLQTPPVFIKSQLPTCIKAAPPPTTPGSSKTSTAGPSSATHGSSKTRTATPRLPSTTVHPPKNPSKTYNKPCDQSDLFGTCSKNERCVVYKMGKTLCKCMEYHTFSSRTGQCEPIPSHSTHSTSTTEASTKSVTAAPSPHKKNSSASGHINKTALIIGCVVSGLVLITIIVIVVVFVTRRMRRRNATHELLLTEEEEEPDEALLT